MHAPLSPPTPSRLLLVEDSETSAVLVSRCLRDRYDIVRAPDGVQAWRVLTTDPSIELVITDVQMPRMGGDELLRTIRASRESRLANLPVIVMTTTDDDADRQLAFRHGASDFVGKPFHPLELQARVRVHHELSRTVRTLQANRRLLQEQATTDPLTRLNNLHAFADSGRRYFALARRHRRSLSLVMLGIDRFDETSGARRDSARDRVLREVAHTLARGIRGGDIPARVGAGKFAILLPNTPRDGAALVAQRVCRALADRSGRATGFSIAVTASAGVACYRADPAENLDHLLELALGRLRLARQSGRSRIVATN